MMILIAAVGLAIGFESTRRRQAAFRQRAAKFARYEDYQSKILVTNRRRLAKYRERRESLRGQVNVAVSDSDRASCLAELRWTEDYLASVQKEVDHDVALDAYFRALVKKYRYAASHAWLPVESDPPWPG
jgi:hypothetical protein